MSSCSEPGQMALRAMQEMNSKLAVFKTPNLPKKKATKMKILTEDHYIEEMGKIIQRDFFPDLEKLKAQNDYLDALEKNDVIRLREIYAKYSGKKPSSRLGFESPATFETPQSKPDSTPHSSSFLNSQRSNRSTSTTSSKKNGGPSDAHNLDSFLANYTSEDNQSFQEIIEAADRRLRQKFSVLYDAEQKTAIENAETLALPSIEQQFTAIEGPLPVNTWTYKNKNYIMYTPDGVELTKEEQLEMAKRKQAVVHNNTRLRSNPFNNSQSKETISEIAKDQAKTQTGKIGVDGVTMASGSPNVRGFSFVQTPSPCPGVTDSPMMTWGEIEGTPFRLDGSDTPIRSSNGPSFRIVETSRREALAHELAEKAGERMRGQKAKAMEAARRNMATPHKRTTLDRLSTMSPAAKHLAKANLCIRDFVLTPSPRHRIGVNTPKNGTPSSQKSTTPSPLVKRKGGPLVTTPIRKGAQNKLDLTDDLLQIPSLKRNKASDFF